MRRIRKEYTPRKSNTTFRYVLSRLSRKERQEIEEVIPKAEPPPIDLPEYTDAIDQPTLDPDEFADWVERLRVEAKARHEERMKAWEHFKTKEYQDEVMKGVLDDTHEDMLPPWLQGEEPPQDLT